VKYIGVTRRSTSLVIQTIHMVDCKGQCGGAGYYYCPIITFMQGKRGPSIKFANSPPFVCRGSTVQKP